MGDRNSDRKASFHNFRVWPATPPHPTLTPFGVGCYHVTQAKAGSQMNWNLPSWHLDQEQPRVGRSEGCSQADPVTLGARD